MSGSEPENPTPQSDFALPLVIAVTGHRDLIAAEIPGIRQCVRDFLRDAGQAGPVGSLQDESVLVGAGAGVSFFGGLVRFDLSGPLNGGSGQGLRFDIVFGAVR